MSFPETVDEILDVSEDEGKTLSEYECTIVILLLPQEQLFMLKQSPKIRTKKSEYHFRKY